MKVERHPGVLPNSKPSATPVGSWATTGPQRSFETALHEQRRRLAPGDKPSQQRPDAANSRSHSTALNEQDRPTTRSTSERAAPSVDRRQLPAAASLVEDSPIPAYLDRALSLRWRRAAGNQSETCIEVVHAASGSRFLLSREDGVWLLAIQSKTTPEDDAIVEALRELFTKRGLGPIDVIKQTS